MPNKGACSQWTPLGVLALQVVVQPLELSGYSLDGTGVPPDELMVVPVERRTCSGH